MQGVSEIKIKSDDNVLIGNNIRNIRKQNNIGQTQLVALM